MLGVEELLKQAPKVQKKIEVLKEELAVRTFGVFSGGDAIKISITVSTDIKNIERDPGFLSEEKEFVEETTLAIGVQEAIETASKAEEEAMIKLPWECRCQVFSKFNDN